MADNAKLDSQFIIDSNKSQHKSTQDELAYKLHRSVRSNRHKLDQIESIKSSSDLRNELKSLYTSIYNDDTQFSERTSQLFHTSIQKIGSEPNNPDLNPFPKPKRRQRRKPKSDDRFTSLWNKSILNKKIKVYWPLDKKYYRGIVSSINENKSKPILIKYSDGDKEWLNLKNETFMFYDTTSDESSMDNDTIDDNIDNDVETSDNSQDIDIRQEHDHDHDDDDDDIDDIIMENKLRKKSKKKGEKKKRKKKRKKKKKLKKKNKSKSGSGSNSVSPKSKKKKKKLKSIGVNEQNELLHDKMSMSMGIGMDEVMNIGMSVTNTNVKPSMSMQENNEIFIPSKVVNIIRNVNERNDGIGDSKMISSGGNNNNEQSCKSNTPQRDGMSVESDGDVVVDSYIDSHVTVIIGGNRYDGIVEEMNNDGLYKIKFDQSNYRESEWVRMEQIAKHEVTVCDNFQIGDNVEVREDGQWLEVEAQVMEIYQGANGIIVKVLFPEYDDVHMYLQERDVKKKG